LPITPHLDDFDVDPETKRVLGVALEMTRVSLGLADDLANGIIAKRIIELAKAGEAIPIRIRSANRDAIDPVPLPAAECRMPADPPAGDIVRERTRRTAPMPRLAASIYEKQPAKVLD
jgi:hypothetical protein